MSSPVCNNHGKCAASKLSGAPSDRQQGFQPSPTQHDEELRILSRIQSTGSLLSLPPRGSISAEAQRPRMSFDAAALEAAGLRSMTRSDPARPHGSHAPADESQAPRLCLNAKVACAASDNPTIANLPHLSCRLRALPRSTSTYPRSRCPLPCPRALRRPYYPLARISAASHPNLCIPSPSHISPRRRYTIAR
jgi:hypothetical protein